MYMLTDFTATPSSISYDTEISEPLACLKLNDSEVWTDAFTSVDSSMALTLLPSRRTSETMFNLYVDHTQIEDVSVKDFLKRQAGEQQDQGTTPLFASQLQDSRTESQILHDVGPDTTSRLPMSRMELRRRLRQSSFHSSCSSSLSNFDWWIQHDQWHTERSRKGLGGSWPEKFSVLLKEHFDCFAFFHNTFEEEMNYREKLQQHYMSLIEAQFVPQLHEISDWTSQPMSTISEFMETRGVVPILILIHLKQFRQCCNGSSGPIFPIDVSWCISEAAYAYAKMILTGDILNNMNVIHFLYGSLCHQERSQLYDDCLRGYTYGAFLHQLYRLGPESLYGKLATLLIFVPTSRLDPLSYRSKQLEEEAIIRVLCRSRKPGLSIPEIDEFMTYALKIITFFRYHQIFPTIARVTFKSWYPGSAPKFKENILVDLARGEDLAWIATGFYFILEVALHDQPLQAGPRQIIVALMIRNK